MSDQLSEALAQFDKTLEPDGPTEAVEETGTPEAPPEVEEPAVEAEAPPEEAAAAEEELILGRFKTADDLAKSYAELEREFGSRNKEWAELKQLREEMQGWREQTDERFQQQTVSMTAPGLIQQHLEQGDYRQAADIAAQIPDGGMVYSQVVGQWRQDDPNGADMYLLLQQNQEALAEQRAQHAQVQQTLNEQAMAAAFSEFARSKPDLEQVAPEMLKAAEESPRILVLLQDPDPQARIEVLDFLYEKAQKRVSGAVTTAAQQVAEEQALEAAVAKKQAHVASPTQRVEAQTKSADEQWLEEFFDPHAAQYMGQ